MNLPIRFPVVAAVVLLMGTGCKTAPRTGFQTDLAAAKQILEADRAFASLSERDGPVVAYRKFAAREIRSLGPVGEPITGIEGMIRGLSANPTLSLQWDPQYAEVARSGDLGWSWGTYVSRGTRPGNTPVVTTGKYLSIWHRQPDGSWKIAIDIGNEAPQR